MRLGEIRALRVEDVKPDHVEIRQTWEQGYGLRPPKADSIRDVPISARLFQILTKVIEDSRPESILFYGRAGKGTPMSKSLIEDRLARALKVMGIPAPEQRKRRLGPHAWRFFLNSLMRSRGVSDAKTRRITGHRSERMTAWYTDRSTTCDTPLPCSSTKLRTTSTRSRGHWVTLPWPSRRPICGHWGWHERSRRDNRHKCVVTGAVRGKNGESRELSAVGIA
jgi:hypothetical protein